MYFAIQWRPALIGFPDTGIYVNDARTGVFNDPLRVGGYSIFLQLLHAIRPHLSFVIVVQHVLGLLSGLALFGAMRRLGQRDALALVPAAVVILGGSELFVEHAPLTEALFIFLVDVGIYAVARAARGGWAWPAVAGLTLGAAVDVRSIGLVLLGVVVVLAAWLCLTQSWPARIARVGILVAAAALPIAAFLIAHQNSQGYGGFTGAGYFDLYARVAPFADCSKFTPPRGTRDLCITIPPSQRPGHDVWEFTSLSPAVRAFGEPDFTVPKPGENAELRSFAEAAILGQPGEYLTFVLHDLVRIVDPSFPSSPYGNRGPTGMGYGSGPEQLLQYYFNAAESAAVQPTLNAYYPDDGIIHRGVGALETYERVTRLDGPLMALLLVLAVVAPILATGARRPAGFFLAMSGVLLVGPILLSEYDYRFTIPAFGPLSATAAIGGAALWRRSRPGAERATRWAIGRVRDRRGGSG